MKLTKMEKMVLNAMRENDYNDALQDGGTWLFCATEYSGLDTKQARGALSSLIKKELVGVTEIKGTPDESMVGFTEAGEKLFENADGEECSWGGPRLLKVEEAEEEKKMTVKELRAEAKEMGIKGYSKMSKEDLQKAIEEIESEGKVGEKTDKTVKMYAFTGMFIGEFEAEVKDGKILVNTSSRGELMFDLSTGKEVCDESKARWANRVEAV